MKKTLKIILSFLLLNIIILSFWWFLNFDGNGYRAKVDGLDKKVFILTGELSGDRLGVWYLNKLKKESPELVCFAVGGDNLQNAGAILVEDFSKLSLGVLGIVKFIKHVPTLYQMYKKIRTYILANHFEKIVLVDCPSVNIPLMRSLKKELGQKIEITYIAPPEMWIWGKCGMDRLFRKYCDHIIVLYPHEVEWYKKEGLNVEYLGYPSFKDFSEYFQYGFPKQNQIAFFLGSRLGEVEILLPVIMPVIKKLCLHYSDLKILLPLPKYFSSKFVEKIKQSFIKEHIDLDRVRFLQEDKEKYKEIAKCCLAVTKPGTVTLELAILKVPSIIVYKLPWISYFITKLMFQVPYVGLPNLFLNRVVFEELIQSRCNSDEIFVFAEKLYKAYLNSDQSYSKILDDLEQVRMLLQE